MKFQFFKMAETSPVQLVDADGEFCVAKIEDFAESSGLLYSGLKYQIVAIMGPQSSGKSTLMNHVVRHIVISVASVNVV